MFFQEKSTSILLLLCLFSYVFFLELLDLTAYAFHEVSISVNPKVTMQKVGHWKGYLRKSSKFAAERLFH